VVNNDGRLEIGEMRLIGVSAAALRRLPIRRIEAALNNPAVDASFFAFDAEATASSGGRLSPEREESFKKAYEHVRALFSPQLRETIKVPKGRGRKPDAFYSQIARAHARLSVTHEHPARRLAERMNVPPTTVYRWLREARRRGLATTAIRKAAH
jgi:hypothetical protein